MAKVVYILQRFNTPLKAIEYVLSFLILAATFITGYNAFYGPDSSEVGRGLISIVSDYKIIPLIYLVMAVFAVINMLVITFSKSGGLRLRSYATFAFAVGFFFEAVLALLVLGPDYLVWANALAVSLISSILYINIKVMQANERRR
jgi:hypothetical protein